MKLIKELTEEVEYITEADEASGKKNNYIRGIFLVGEQKNKNGRIYPISTLEKEAERYCKEIVEQKRAYGELGHPKGPQINLDRVSHIITELKRDGNTYIGKARLTETPMGEIAKGLLNSGASLGVSCRGMGRVEPCKKTGVMVVQDDYKIATAADIVADPSAPGAFVQGIMENVEWIYDPVSDSWLEEKLNNTKKSIRKMSMSQIEESKLSIFEDYISSLSLKR
jgi:predicted RNA-binding protein